MCEYAAPTCPPGSAVVVISGGGTGAGATVTESACVSAWAGEPESVTFAVNGNEPAVVGVPDDGPVAGSSVRPGGSEPDSSDHVYGGVPLVAASVCEYGCADLAVRERRRRDRQAQAEEAADRRTCS